MSIEISPSSRILGASPKTGVDKFNSFVGLALERYKDLNSGLTDKEREIFQDLVNELHIKYLAGLVDNKIILLSVDPTKLSDKGCPEAKVYELIFDEKERFDKDGSFLKLKKISSKPLNWFVIQQKISTDPNFKAQMDSTVKACNILLNHHSPREENIEDHSGPGLCD